MIQSHKASQMILSVNHTVIIWAVFSPKQKFLGGLIYGKK